MASTNSFYNTEQKVSPGTMVYSSILECTKFDNKAERSHNGQWPVPGTVDNIANNTEMGNNLN